MKIEGVKMSKSGDLKKITKVTIELISFTLVVFLTILFLPLHLSIEFIKNEGV